jgi:hypothetical protein
MIETQFFLGALETFLDRQTQARRAGELGHRNAILFVDFSNPRLGSATGGSWECPPRHVCSKTRPRAASTSGADLGRPVGDPPLFALRALFVLDGRFGVLARRRRLQSGTQPGCIGALRGAALCKLLLEMIGEARRQGNNG